MALGTAQPRGDSLQPCKWSDHQGLQTQTYVNEESQTMDFVH